MNLSPDQLIANLLEEHHPKNVLLFGDEQPPAVKEYLESQKDNCQLQTINDASLLATIATRFDICLIAPDFINQSKQSGIELLAGIRNRLCHHIYLFIPLKENNLRESHLEKNDWQESDLFSLGLKRLAQFKPQTPNSNEPVLNCFAYQIESYIKKRDWNNARFWANPERFGKHWW